MEMCKAVVSHPFRFNVIFLRFSYHFFQLQGAIWSAAAKEDYRVATLPSGEPVLATMHLSIENPDLAIGAENIPLRHLPDGISAYELWQLQKLKRDIREEYLDYWNASVKLTGTGRPVDAILSPCAPYVAPPHNMNRYVFIFFSLFSE
jgi:amidase